MELRVYLHVYSVALACVSRIRNTGRVSAMIRFRQVQYPAALAKLADGGGLFARRRLARWSVGYLVFSRGRAENVADRWPHQSGYYKYTAGGSEAKSSGFHAESLHTPCGC